MRVLGGWACLDLNQGPPLYQSGALTELSYRPLDTAKPYGPVRRVNLQHEAARDKRRAGTSQIEGSRSGKYNRPDTGDRLRWGRTR